MDKKITKFLLYCKIYAIMNDKIYYFYAQNSILKSASSDVKYRQRKPQRRHDPVFRDPRKKYVI